MRGWPGKCPQRLSACVSTSHRRSGMVLRVVRLPIRRRWPTLSATLVPRLHADPFVVRDAALVWLVGEAVTVGCGYHTTATLPRLPLPGEAVTIGRRAHTAGCELTQTRRTLSVRDSGCGHAASPAAESRRSRSKAALTSARCVNAWGKLPRCWACGPSSSPYNPR